MPNDEIKISFPTAKVDGQAIQESLFDHLTSIEVELMAGLPAMCTLVFHDNELTIQNGTTLGVGKELVVGFLVSGGSTVEIFKGEIVIVQPEYVETMISFKVIAFDKLHRLTRGAKSRVFKDVKDSEVISSIAGERAVPAGTIQATTTIHKHVFQDNVSDLDFIQMLARRNSLEVACVNGQLTAKPPAGTPEVTVKFGDNLIEFRPRASLAGQVNEVEVKSWNPQSKAAILGKKTSSTAHPQVGFNNGSFGGATAQAKIAAATHTEIRLNAASQAEAETYAQSKLDEFNAQFIVAEGTLQGNTSVRPGMKLKVENVGTNFCGTYLVTSACHTYDHEYGYRTHFSAEGNRSSLLSTMIAPQPEKPQVWYGVVPAIVTNNNDDGSQNDAPPANTGRVKVKYPWLSDQLESYWARVASPGAGNSRGLMMIPEVNDEVLVAFENGDFNRPYVIGGLWNGSDALPETQTTVVADGKVVIRELKTRSGHIIRFTDDDVSKIEIIEAAKSYAITMDGQNEKITIVGTSGEKIEMDMQNKKISILATETIEIKAKAINIEASQTLTAKGTSGVTMESSSTTTIKGSQVKIN